MSPVAAVRPDPAVTVVIPTVGRPSLRRLLVALSQSARRPGAAQPPAVVVVDDRPPGQGPLAGLPATPAGSVEVLASGHRGPAAARNVGWRAATSDWVAFLDDDVVPNPDWVEALAADLRDLPADVAGSQGRLSVPVPEGRAPTDWERQVAGLATACWATADLAYRRQVLEEVGGFDERFRRAYREDTDLGLRVTRAGYLIVRGERGATHPVGSASRWVSLARQRGNADDMAMRAIHGPDWRIAGGAPAGRAARHAAVTAAGVVGLVAGLARRRRMAGAAGAAWLAGTAELAWARIAPGPRTAGEVATMVLTSLALPAAATWWRMVGLAALVKARPARPGAPQAVLFDRDGTLVEDVAYNGDPARVRLRPGAREALDRLRSAGVAVGVVSNQSGVAAGKITLEQVEAVNRRVEELAGPIGTWAVCPHGAGEGCGCRKPAPGLVRRAARELGADPRRCVVIGDIGADVGAALAAGARPILVPTPATRAAEVAASPEVCSGLREAVQLALGEGPAGRPARRSQL